MARSEYYSYSYECDLTPEEKIEMLYTEPVEQFNRIGRFHAFEWKTQKRYSDIAKIRQELPRGSEEKPFHMRVWYPESCRKSAGMIDTAAIKRKKRRKRKTNVKELLSKYPANMNLICTGFLGEADESGPSSELRLQKEPFGTALKGLGIHDQDVIKKAFDFFCQPQSEPPYVIFTDLIDRISQAINDDDIHPFTQVSCTERCFNLFAGLGGNLHYSKTKPKPEFDGCQYIHAEQLAELRRLRSVNQMPPRSYLMVKVLIEIFSSARKAEEEQFLLNLGKSKKGGKKKPPVIAPLRLRDEMRDFHRSRHISFPEFRASMRTNPDMVVAFFPIYLSDIIAS
eukprot:TRINITY_DN18731_c0_g1_i1.p1 TRINITY_DN18731_c0_g1~~TRINITY_DN18731_c0_g1_i1.p1  ORF type:complete len:340 (+),score=64.30 TRINITY_DN18731_c0_g1_i1:146-1165(+)